MLQPLFLHLLMSLSVLFLFYQAYFRWRDRIRSDLAQKLVLGLGFGLVQSLYMVFPVVLPGAHEPIIMGVTTFITAAVYGGEIAAVLSVALQAYTQWQLPGHERAAGPGPGGLGQRGPQGRPFDGNRPGPAGAPDPAGAHRGGDPLAAGPPDGSGLGPNPLPDSAAMGHPPMGGFGPEWHVALLVGFGLLTVAAFRYLPWKRWVIWLMLTVAFELGVMGMSPEPLHFNLIRMGAETASGSLLFLLIAYLHKNEEGKRKLERLAETDPLTGLYNVGHFKKVLKKLHQDSRKGKDSFALLILDIDHFKSINDTWGHPVGDRVLIELAGLLKLSFTNGETLCRNGGEEFTVLLPYGNERDVIQASDRFLEAVRGHAFLRDADEGPLKVTVSAGLEIVTGEGGGPQQIYEKADQALYKAKQGGRNRLCLAGSGAV